jgi:serine/threonine protein kinase
VAQLLGLERTTLQTGWLVIAVPDSLPALTHHLADISQETADQQWQETIDHFSSESARKGATSSKEDFVIFCDLLRRMLKIDPSARLTIEEVLAHPWHTQTSYTCGQTKLSDLMIVEYHRLLGGKN